MTIAFIYLVRNYMSVDVVTAVLVSFGLMILDAALMFALLEWTVNAIGVIIRRQL